MTTSPKLTEATPQQLARLMVLTAVLGHDVMMRELRHAKLHDERKGAFLDRMEREYGKPDAKA